MNTMKRQSILVFLLSACIILKGCIWTNNAEKAYAIEQEYRICFPKMHTWQNPSPTQKITPAIVSRILSGATVMAHNPCIEISDVKLSGKPETFSWWEKQEKIEVNGLIIRVSCKVQSSATCQPSKNAIELVLPEASVFAHETQTFPKQLVELPTNMSSIALSSYWDLPQTWDFGIQLHVLEVLAEKS